MFDRNRHFHFILAILALSLLVLGACAAGAEDVAPTPPAETQETVVLYWLDETELRAVSYTLPETDNPAEAALEALLEGPPSDYETAIPTPEEIANYPGREPAWGERVRLQGLTIEDGVATVNFSDEMRAYGGGSARVQAIREQITQTLLQFPTIDEVRIAVEGEVDTALQP